MDKVISFPNNLLGKHVEINYLMNDLSISYKFLDDLIDDLRLKDIGKKIWKLIELYNDCSNVKPNNDINFILYSRIQEIHKIPWEIAFKDDLGFLFLQKNFSFSRTFYSLYQTKRINNINALHVSFENDDVMLNQEIGNLIKVFRNSEHNINFVNIKRFHVVATLQKPNVIIFSAHGEYSYEPHAGKNSSYSLSTNDYEINSFLELISSFKKKQRPDLIIINACESSKNLSSLLDNNTAYNFLNSGVSGFIGMREPILNVSATMFICSFFRKLIVSKNIIQSLQYSRLEITQPMKFLHTDIRKYISYGQWALPELYLGEKEKNEIR